MNQSLYRKRRLQINTSNKKIDLLEQQKSLEQERQEIEFKEPREAEKPDFSQLRRLYMEEFRKKVGRHRGIHISIAFPLSWFMGSR